MTQHVRVGNRTFSLPETGDLGEKNTATNQGGGAGLALPKNGTTLPFKSLVAGANITFDIGPDTITINGEEGGGTSGEANKVARHYSIPHRKLLWSKRAPVPTITGVLALQELHIHLAV